MPVAIEVKAHLVRTKVYPAALYGAEAAPIPKKQRAKLAAAVLDALLGRAATGRSQDLAWVALGVMGLRSPDAEVAYRRVRLARAMREDGGRPWADAEAAAALYHERGERGTGAAGHAGGWRPSLGGR